MHACENTAWPRWSARVPCTRARACSGCGRSRPRLRSRRRGEKWRSSSAACQPPPPPPCPGLPRAFLPAPFLPEPTRFPLFRCPEPTPRPPPLLPAPPLPRASTTLPPRLDLQRSSRASTTSASSPLCHSGSSQPDPGILPICAGNCANFDRNVKSCISAGAVTHFIM